MHVFIIGLLIRKVIHMYPCMMIKVVAKDFSPTATHFRARRDERPTERTNEGDDDDG